MAELSCPCCPKQLLEQHLEMMSMSSTATESSNSSSAFTIGGGRHEDDQDVDGAALETVYTALQSDPYLMAFGTTNDMGANE